MKYTMAKNFHPWGLGGGGGGKKKKKNWGGGCKKPKYKFKKPKNTKENQITINRKIKN